jgi:hypothetical protein
MALVNGASKAHPTLLMEARPVTPAVLDCVILSLHGWQNTSKARTSGLASISFVFAPVRCVGEGKVARLAFCPPRRHYPTPFGGSPSSKLALRMPSSLVIHPCPRGASGRRDQDQEEGDP